MTSAHSGISYIHLTIVKKQPSWWSYVFDPLRKEDIVTCQDDLSGEDAMYLASVAALHGRPLDEWAWLHRAVDETHHGP